MNSKITLSRFASMLADRTGRNANECEDFLKKFFNEISSSLLNGEKVRIKGLGTFKISMVDGRDSIDVSTGKSIHIPPHEKIVFLPAKELASAVNAPFEIFETIELEESVLDEELSMADMETDPFLSNVNPVPEQIIIENEKRSELFDKYPAEKEDMERVEEELLEQGITMEVSSDNTNEETSDSDENAEDEGDADVQEIDAEEGDYGETVIATEEGVDEVKDISNEENKVEANNADDGLNGDSDSSHHHRRSFGHGFLWGLLAALVIILLGAGILFWLNDDFAGLGKAIFAKHKRIGAVITDSTSLIPSDSIELRDEAILAAGENDIAEASAGTPDIVEDEIPDKVVPTQPSDNKSYQKYDTITHSRFLTTMAKRHYGNFHLWPYIYKENEKILGHPDRIRPGTRVVIPDLKKYGVDPKNSGDIEKSKKMGEEIYSRYK